MPYTEFCCKSGGSNLNAGTRTGSTTEPGTAADFTYASGNWVQATRVFTVASGNPQTDGVAVGDFVSVYADGSTATAYVARVTAVNATTITTSATARAGTAPTDGTGNRTLKVGGAWQGPTGTSGVPLTLTNQGALTNVAGDTVRFNFKSTASFLPTAAMTLAASITLQGYTTSYGDGGKATIDGGTGAAYNVLTTSGSPTLTDLIFYRNGDTGVNYGLVISAAATFNRCVFRDMLFSSIQSSADVIFVQCEFYNNNLSNTGGGGGVEASSATFIRCISHHNSGSNSAGFITGQSCIYCIAANNGGIGFASVRSMNGCVAYANGGVGFSLTNTNAALVENSLAVSNTGNGITGSIANGAFLFNNGFFGNAAQTSGINSNNIVGSITLNGDPFIDAANGNFALNAAGAQLFGAGIGSFTQTALYTSSTSSSPTVGAAIPVAGAYPAPTGRSCLTTTPGRSC